MTKLEHNQLNSYTAIAPNSAFDNADLEMLVCNLWGSARMGELMPLLRKRRSACCTFSATIGSRSPPPLSAAIRAYAFTAPIIVPLMK